MAHRTVLAALVYALAVFAVGFLVGTIRVLVLAPRAGALGAVAIELPIMIAASWIAARWIVAHWRVDPHLPDRLGMGALAFAMLLLCELLVSVTLFGGTPDEFVRQYARPDALLGLAGQLVFAAMPALLLLGGTDRT
jgi:hypothetical protein